VSEANDPPPNKPLLILVTQSSELPARLRSRERDVRCWVEGDAADGQFSGDPCDPASYEWVRPARGVTAIIDLESTDRARCALEALRQVRADAAVLVLSPHLDDVDHDHDGTMARGGELRDVLRLDLDEELERLEAERRAWCLRDFAAGDEVVPILIHNDPDPDAVSSALAVVQLLGGSGERTPIVTLQQVQRPENRRMMELLKIRVTEITREELQQFSRIITVDTQPRGLQQEGRPRFAVIDHHPPEDGYDAEFLDIRPEYGATATMLTEYLRASQARRVGHSLATALLFGIKTDTDSLTRAVTPADVAAYAFLQERADLQLVRRFDRPSYSPEAVRVFGRALESAVVDDGLCAAWLGTLTGGDRHLLAEVADFCLAIETVTWVAVGAWVDDELILTIRHGGGTSPGAGDVARTLAEPGGRGGGHATMARVTLPRDAATRLVGDDDDGDMVEAVRSAVRRTVADLMGGEVSRPA
jgi:nanoRNase/pAp phosphatase (c-di-AMP/oligoRNAs hydrolase)